MLVRSVLRLSSPENFSTLVIAIELVDGEYRGCHIIVYIYYLSFGVGSEQRKVAVLPVVLLGFYETRHCLLPAVYTMLKNSANSVPQAALV